MICMIDTVQLATAIIKAFTPFSDIKFLELTNHLDLSYSRIHNLEDNKLQISCLSCRYSLNQALPVLSFYSIV